MPMLVGKNKIEFQKHQLGYRSNCLPMPETTDQEVLQKFDQGWSAIIKIAKTWQLFLNYHCCESRLVFSRKSRKAPERNGLVLASFYLDDLEEVGLLCIFLNSVLSKLGKSQNLDRMVGIKLNYHFSIIE